MASELEPGFEVIKKQLSPKQSTVVLEIPCVHYLLAQFKEHWESLTPFLTINAFQLSYLTKDDNRFSLLGFNLYSLLNLKINDNNTNKLPIILNNKEEFFNFFCEKKDNNNYPSIYCNSLFPYCDFKLNIEDLIYDNDKITMQGRGVTIYLFNLRINCSYKNLNELNHHEKLPLDNLIKYKIENQQIDFDFSPSAFFDLLIMKNYFLKSSINDQFCITLIEKNPELFTPEIMALICLKIFALHEILIQHFPKDYYPIDMVKNKSLTHINSNNTTKEKIMLDYSSLIQETQYITNKLMSTDTEVQGSWKNLLIHLDAIIQENGIQFLCENIEEKITFENIISKYIPSILNNYLSIPSHLRVKENTPFISMTLTQFNNIEKELEKIELAIIEEDIKKMKVFGRFLDNRLGNNTPEIIHLG